MLKIRLQRVGRKHEPVFRLVVVDSHAGPKSGKAVEVLGSYDSRRGEKAEFKSERIKHWIKVGAQTSGTVHNLLINKGIIEGKKINVLPKKKPIIKESSEAEESKTETPSPEAKEEKPEEKLEEKAKEESSQEIKPEKVEEAKEPSKEAESKEVESKEDPVPNEEKSETQESASEEEPAKAE